MALTNQNFFSTIFDENEQTCLADSIKSTRVTPIVADSSVHHWFCLNPLDATQDKNPSQEWHRADKPRRADCNVTAYRNILVEMDKTPLAEQEAIVRELGLPFSTKVFSGGKSYHFIVSLSEPCQDLEDYRDLAKRIYAVFGGKNTVDVSNGNPSRLTRFPGAYRVETGNQQTLLEVRNRVSRSELEKWLEDNSQSKPKQLDQAKMEAYLLAKYGDYPEQEVVKQYPSFFTRKYLENGAPEGERNSSLFKVACDLFRSGYSEAEVIQLIESVNTLPNQETLTTIRSAKSKAR